MAAAETEYFDDRAEHHGRDELEESKLFVAQPIGPVPRHRRKSMSSAASESARSRAGSISAGMVNTRLRERGMQNMLQADSSKRSVDHYLTMQIHGRLAHHDAEVDRELKNEMATLGRQYSRSAGKKANLNERANAAHEFLYLDGSRTPDARSAKYKHLSQTALAYEENLTFTPKLNHSSIELAHSRRSKIMNHTLNESRLHNAGLAADAAAASSTPSKANTPMAPGLMTPGSTSKNDVSRASTAGISGLSGLRTSSSAVELLAAKPITLQRMVQMEEERTKEYTFKPSLSTRSLQLAGARDDELHQGQLVGEKRTELMYQLGRQWQDHREKLHEQAAVNEMEGCTFQPDLSHNDHDDPRPFLERYEAWMQMRAEDRAAWGSQTFGDGNESSHVRFHAGCMHAAGEYAKNEAHNCTFQPRVNPHVVAPVVESPWGVSSYLNRAKEARAERDRVANMLNFRERDNTAATPSKYKHHADLLVTEPFNFNVPLDSTPPSLRKPMPLDPKAPILSKIPTPTEGDGESSGTQSDYETKAVKRVKATKERQAEEKRRRDASTPASRERRRRAKSVPANRSRR